MTGSPGLSSGFQLSKEVVNPSANRRQNCLNVPLETTPLAMVEQAEIWVDSSVTTTDEDDDDNPPAGLNAHKGLKL